MLNIQKKMSNGFYALLSLPATAMGFALSVQISALSWILSTKYGLDIHEIGIVWAAGPIAGIIAQPIVGLVSDKLWFMGGRRRPWILLGGILMVETFPQLLLVGIILYALTTLFAFITLPVEINASRRAIAWLEQSGITDYQTTPMASSALRSAAYTYVVAALSSLGTLIYYILIFTSRRD